MSGQAAAPGRTPSGSEDHSDRIHPNLILSVLSLAGLAYSVLSSAVIPALPDLQHSLPTVTGFNDTYVMATTFLVVCVLAGVLIPDGHRAPEPAAQEGQLAAASAWGEG